MTIVVEPMQLADWPDVSRIYAEGIATGHATFTREPPAAFADFEAAHVPGCNLVAREPGGGALGWVVLSRTSGRFVYSGVAELSIYVGAASRRLGIGDTLLRAVIAQSEAAGFWTLQAGIFPENTSSLALHTRHGFRQVGRRERIGKMTFGAWAGRWRDTVLLERRSSVAGLD